MGEIYPNSPCQIMIREGIGMSSLPVEFFLGQFHLTSIVGRLLCFSIIFSLLTLVGLTCHLGWDLKPFVRYGEGLCAGG